MSLQHSPNIPCVSPPASHATNSLHQSLCACTPRPAPFLLDTNAKLGVGGGGMSSENAPKYALGQYWVSTRHFIQINSLPQASHVPTQVTIQNRSRLFLPSGLELDYSDTPRSQCPLRKPFPLLPWRPGSALRSPRNRLPARLASLLWICAGGFCGNKEGGLWPCRCWLRPTA